MIKNYFQPWNFIKEGENNRYNIKYLKYISKINTLYKHKEYTLCSKPNYQKVEEKISLMWI